MKTKKAIQTHPCSCQFPLALDLNGRCITCRPHLIIPNLELVKVPDCEVRQKVAGF